MYVFVSESVRPFGSYAIATIPGSICDASSHNVTFNTSTGNICKEIKSINLSPGDWNSIKHMLGQYSKEIRLYILRAADADYLKSMWYDIDVVSDGDPICHLYQMTSLQIKNVINQVLCNTCLIDSSYDWIHDVYKQSMQKSQYDWCENAPMESDLIRSSRHQIKHQRSLDLFDNLMLVELVVSCIDDILKIPLVKQLYIMPSTLIHSRNDMHIGMGLYSAVSIDRGQLITQYDGVWSDAATRSSHETSHHMAVQFGIRSISGTRSARFAVGHGGLSFCNSKPRRECNVSRFSADALSTHAFGPCHVPRVIASVARCNIHPHTELFMWYKF